VLAEHVLTVYLGIAHWDSLGQIIEQTEIANELNVTPVLDKIQEHRRNWLQNVNRMPCNRLSRKLKTADLQAEESRGDHEREFETCDTKKGQQVADHHVGWMMMMMVTMIFDIPEKGIYLCTLHT